VSTISSVNTPRVLGLGLLNLSAPCIHTQATAAPCVALRPAALLDFRCGSRQLDATECWVAVGAAFSHPGKNLCKMCCSVLCCRLQAGRGVHAHEGRQRWLLAGQRSWSGAAASHALVAGAPSTAVGCHSVCCQHNSAAALQCGRCNASLVTCVILSNAAVPVVASFRTTLFYPSVLCCTVLHCAGSDPQGPGRHCRAAAYLVLRCATCL
jgi:hypothetical protein